MGSKMGQKPTRSVTGFVSKVFCFAGPFIGAYPIEGVKPLVVIRRGVIWALYLRYHVETVSPRAYPIETVKSEMGFRRGPEFHKGNPIGEDLIRLISHCLG